MPLLSESFLEMVTLAAAPAPLAEPLEPTGAARPAVS